MKRSVALLLVLLLLFNTLLSGCSKKDKASSNTEPPLFSPLQVLIPSADGKRTSGSDSLVLDLSHTDHGYLTALTDNSSPRFNLQIIDPQNVTYSYFLEPDDQTVIPFTGGEGTYTITGYEQLSGSQYAALFYETLDLTLSNVFYPFLYPNQYVNFTAESEASKLALSMISEDAQDLDALDAIYQYVISHITYDYDKAETVEAGYLPDVDETLSTGTGICFDYAALMTCMLRSRDIPCKLQIGYSANIKHAWIDVYIRSVGWIDKAIVFDGDTWTRMDPTFDSTGNETDSIREYIGNGENYTVQFTR